MYIAIDLKSFYASVECVDKGLDPLTTNLVVADASRTEKTICLAVSPSLKKYGIPGRARLFEVIQKVREVNNERRRRIPGGGSFTGESYDDNVLTISPSISVGYITAPPRMARYMEFSTQIYNIYLRYIAPEDIHVYSIDEVFVDVAPYSSIYGLDAHELAVKMVKEVYNETGITATVGIGTNLYLCKVAMDIVAKHMPADHEGMRIAELDEMSYRHLLWNHRPITDFWRVGRGYATKLENNGMYTMGDVARCSLGSKGDYYNEELLYKLFGINAELLIDHAWGYEPCTIAAIKAYKPVNNSISSGQVLSSPYDSKKARIIVHEMTDLLVLDLVSKRLVTDQLILTIGYDVSNLTDPAISKQYRGPVTEDRYGRAVPKHAHGTVNLDRHSSSTRKITEAVLGLYDRIMNPVLYARRITIAANHVINEDEAAKNTVYEQPDIFTDYEMLDRQKKQEEEERKKERSIQEAVIDIHNKYGKNALLKGINYEEGATTRERNSQIGGHRA
jgi:DNA polymerase V